MAKTLDDLILLGRKKGMRNPELWAAKVMSSRLGKYEKPPARITAAMAESMPVEKLPQGHYYDTESGISLQSINGQKFWHVGGVLYDKASSVSLTALRTKVFARHGIVR